MWLIAGMAVFGLGLGSLGLAAVAFWAAQPGSGPTVEPTPSEAAAPTAIEAASRTPEPAAEPAPEPAVEPAPEVEPAPTLEPAPAVEPAPAPVVAAKPVVAPAPTAPKPARKAKPPPPPAPAPQPVAPAEPVQRISGAMVVFRDGTGLVVRCGDTTARGTASARLRNFPAGACSVQGQWLGERYETEVDIRSRREVHCSVDGGSLTCK